MRIGFLESPGRKWKPLRRKIACLYCFWNFECHWKTGMLCGIASPCFTHSFTHSSVYNLQGEDFGEEWKKSEKYWKWHETSRNAKKKNKSEKVLGVKKWSFLAVGNRMRQRSGGSSLEVGSAKVGLAWRGVSQGGYSLEGGSAKVGTAWRWGQPRWV